MTQRIVTTLFLFFFLSAGTSAHLLAQDKHKTRATAAEAAKAQSQSITGAKVSCQNGLAAGYPCQLADMHAFVSIFDLHAGLSGSGQNANDIWGWTDPQTGNDYALVGMTNGTSIVNVTDTENPVF